MKKKIIALAALVFGAVIAFAEGSTPTMDTTNSEAMLTAAQTGLSSLLSAAAPVITTIVLAGLAIWGGLALIRIIKRAFGRSA